MIKTIGVIGAGTMGNGIAQTFAQSGFSVILLDVAQPMLDRARGTIEAGLGKFVEKGRLSAADRDATLARLATTTTLDRLVEADYIVELGPVGGPDGGELLYQGELAGLLKVKGSPTAPYLRTKLNK